MIAILHYLKDPKLINYGNDGKFLIMGTAGFIKSTVASENSFTRVDQSSEFGSENRGLKAPALGFRV